MTANGLTINIDRSSVMNGDYGYGGYISDASLTVHDKADITITGNESVDIRTNALRLANGAEVVLEKGGTLTASGSKNENWGLALENGSNFKSTGPLTITASGGSDWEIGNNYYRDPSAYGIYMNSSTGEFSEETSISASGNSYMNTGILSEESKLKMAKTVIDARDGETAEAFSIYGGSAEFTGDLTVTAEKAINAYGVRVATGKNGAARFTANNVNVTVEGEEAAGGVQINGEGTTASLSGTLFAKVSGGTDYAYGIQVQGADATLSAQNAFITSDKTAIQAIRGGDACFAGIVTTDAAITAEARDEKSEIIFEKGLFTLAKDTTMTAADGAKISVNSTGAGLVAYTGTTSVSDGFIDMTLNGGGSYWRMTGDSSASTLVNNGTLLDMTADDNKFSTLTLANLNGTNGLVAMDIDASKNTDNSDIILVDDTFSGTQRVSFNRIDAQADADAAGTVIAKVNNNDGVFIAPADEEGALFYKRYLLDTKESETAGYTTDWYIKELANVDPSEKPTTTVNSVMSAASLNYHTWRTQNDKLMQRMGDLRKSGGANNGAWFRFGGSKISLGGGHGFDNEYMYYEVGYDRIIRETSQYTWFGGVAFSYGEGDSSYARGDGDNESKAVSLYLTQINKGGSYLDLVFKLGRWDDDFAVRDSYGERITGETENSGISFSAEYGKKIALNKNGFYIEPQAQLTYGHLDGDTYTTSNGVSVHQEGIESLVGRFGFNLGWDISKTSNIYLKASVLHEFLGDYGVSMSDATGRVRLSGDYGDTWFEYGLGAAFTLGKRGNDFLYFDVERSEGGDLDMEWRWNAGFRFEM